MEWHNKELSFDYLVKTGNKYDEMIAPYLKTSKFGVMEDFSLDDEQTMGYTLKTMGSAL